MLRMRKRLGCCSRDREISIDLDEQERVMTYNGLESCILNSQSYENESRTSRDDGFHTESFEGDESISTSSSSSKDGFGSVSSKWVTVKKRDDKELDDWEIVGSPQHFYVKEKKPLYDDTILQNADVETMKEKFSKLLLGEDHSGGCKGISTALALSNAITSLAAMTFGELWKLEPLCEERKSRWRMEMGWLLSPTKYMVELVPAKQSGANGCTLEIMTPKARADIHMNLPALKKLDSMLIEMLDAMVNNEFWYAEGGSRAEGRSKRWWLPSPQVPSSGLSDTSRKKLMCQGRLVLQVLKAAKSINENMLLEMSVPTIIKNALPKSGRANLSDKLYKALTAESSSVEDIFNSLKLKSEHGALDCINKLEAAVLAWKEKISSDRTTPSSSKSPLWSPFMKDALIELDKTETLLERAESLVRYLKYKYPNLPQTFLDVTKVKYGKDVGHAILEAYSRALANLAYRILCRIQDVLQEDVMCSPNSPAAQSCCYPPCPSSSSSNNNCSYFVESPASSIRHSLTDKMNKVDGRDSCTTSTTSDSETTSANEVKMRSVVVVVKTPTVNCV